MVAQRTAQMDPSAPSEALNGHPRYKKLEELNNGSYGFVQLARDQYTGQKVAIKFMQRGEKLNGKYVEREIVNHKSLLHPHVIQFKEVFLTPDFLAIAMEYAPGGDMFQFVKGKGRLPEHEARWFFQQLVVGLDYCHRMGVVSRDIKLENTLLDGSKNTLRDGSKLPLLKICDFGYSKHTEKDSVPKSKVGTPAYTAPEILLNRCYDGKMVDVWSAGVMLYVMLFGQYPFECSEDDKEVPAKRVQMGMERLLKGDYKIPAGVATSQNCKDLLARILVTDPTKRISIQQIQRHPWYLEHLPRGLSTFNDSCLLQHQTVLQSRVDVTRIVQEAQIPASRLSANGSAGTVNSDEDGMDDVMDGDSME